MDLQCCYNASEDTFPLPRHIKERYGPFGFPAPPDVRRPYISSNFVMGLDGRASFRELEGRNDGNTVSRSREDRWLMDFLRAHHDGQLLGASTLRDEVNPEGRGWDYAIDDEELRIYRQDTLRLGRQKVLVLSGSGNIDVTLRLFSSPRVDVWIITAREGQEHLRSQLKRLGREGTINILSVGEGTRVDLVAAAQLLRQEHGIRTLLCEGGPTLYGEFLQGRDRPTDGVRLPKLYTRNCIVVSIDKPSLCAASPCIFRLRYEGPRTFQD